MISYEEAQKLLAAIDLPAGEEAVPLLEAGGRYLSRAPRAPFPLPRFNNSAMDGFVVRSAELPASLPAELPIGGESAAGHPFVGTAPPGVALRISTGAPMPEGFDTIVPVESTELVEGNPHAVRIKDLPARGSHLRREGSDIAAGSELLPVGARLGGAQIALLAAFNIEQVTVWKRPRIGLLTSGDELIPLGGELAPSQVVASSRYYLEHELTACGAEVKSFGIAPDRLSEYEARFAEALAWSDLLITTAAASVGEHDHAGEVIARLGGHLHFWRVAVRPGKPMMLAQFDDKYQIGLPGNPVSTHCNTEVFIKPVLQRHFRGDNARNQRVPMRLVSDCPVDRARLFFVYAEARWGADGWAARPLANQNSGNLALPALANALIAVPPWMKPLPAGTMVEGELLTEGLGER